MKISDISYNRSQSKYMHAEAKVSTTYLTYHFVYQNESAHLQLLLKTRGSTKARMMH